MADSTAHSPDSNNPFSPLDRWQRCAAVVKNHKLSTAQAALLGVIAMRDGGGGCFAKRETLMAESGIGNKNTFAAAKRALLAAGLVRAEAKWKLTVFHLGSAFCAVAEVPPDKSHEVPELVPDQVPELVPDNRTENLERDIPQSSSTLDSRLGERKPPRRTDDDEGWSITVERFLAEAGGDDKERETFTEWAVNDMAIRSTSALAKAWEKWRVPRATRLLRGNRLRERLIADGLIKREAA